MTIVADRSPAGAATSQNKQAMTAMIDGQLRSSGVNAEWILRRMAEVPREDFVPEVARGHAYIDRAISLGNGRSLAAPVVHGMLLQEADPTTSDDAIVVDACGGYMSELLRPLVGSLETVDPATALTSARGKGTATLLVIDGAIEQLPDSLVPRLAEGGRVVTGLSRDGITSLAIGRKVAGQVALLPLLELGIPVLPEFAAPKRWTF